jgi:hypothetical protein
VFVGGASFSSGGFLEALLEPWKSFKELWRPSRVWRCTKAGLVLFGGISKHWMCMCPHSSIVSLDLSWLSAL